MYYFIVLLFIFLVATTVLWLYHAVQYVKKCGNSKSSSYEINSHDTKAIILAMFSVILILLIGFFSSFL